MLANSLWRARQSNELSFEEKTKNLKESIEINERILEDCTDDDIRSSAIQILVYTYSDNKYSFADENKAAQYAKKMPSYYTSSDILLENAYFTDEGIKKAQQQKHFNNLSFMDHITRNIRNSNLGSPEERIFAYESALKLWNTLIYDGNFLFYHGRIADFYDAIAKNYAILKNRDKVFENLKSAKIHADKYDSQQDGDQYYTSCFVSKAYSNHSGTTKNYTESDAELIKNEFSDSIYDFIREDPDFIAFKNSF